MKKKLLIALFALISVFCFAFGLSACGGGSKAQQIEIGDTKSKVEKLLGLPDEESSGKWEYYGSEYTKLLKQEEEISEKMFSAKNDSELEKYAKQLEEIENKLLNMEYPYTVVYFNNNKVSSVIFDAKHSEEGGGEKEVKQIQLSSDTVPLFSDIRSSGIYVKITYTDGSYKNTPIENAGSFNSSTPGTKMVEWSDEWGKYSAKVTVGNVIKKDMSFSGEFGENRFIATALETGTLDNVKFSVTFEILSSDGVLVSNNDGKWDSIKEQVEDITIPDVVTEIGNYAFRNCISLKNITLPDSVKSIGESAFSRCTSLASVRISDGIENVGVDAFEGCVNLRFNEHENISYLGNDENPYIVLVKVKNKSLNSYNLNENTKVIASSAFKDCTSFTSIEIPEGVKNIGSDAFENCPIETAAIPAVVCQSIAIPSLRTLVITSGERIYASMLENLANLVSVTIPKSVTSIAGNTFSRYNSLTIYCEADSKPDGWNEKWNFSDCPVVWNCKNNDKDSDGNAYAVIGGIRYSFKDGIAVVVGQPRNITDANIPATVTYKNESFKVTGIAERAFWICDVITSITIPDSVTSIGEDAFLGCSSLTNITIPDSVTSIGESAFHHCSSLTNITIPDSVTSIGESAFGDCSSLTSITIPDSVTNIGKSAFRGCNSLTSITIPDSVTSIGEDAFSDCSSLTSITIPDSVTSIGYATFSDCSSLTSITIPDSVTNIAMYAFFRCSSLKDINFEGTKAQWKAIKKNRSWNSETADFTVHCTDGNLSKSES